MKYTQSSKLYCNVVCLEIGISNQYLKVKFYFYFLEIIGINMISLNLQFSWSHKMER